jgi:hypothetical protein
MLQSTTAAAASAGVALPLSDTRAHEAVSASHAGASTNAGLDPARGEAPARRRLPASPIPKSVRIGERGVLPFSVSSTSAVFRPPRPYIPLCRRLQGFRARS